MNERKLLRVLVLASSVAIVSLVAATLVGAAPPTTYQIEHLVSDGSVPSESLDPQLRNAWGLAAAPNSPWWVTSNAVDLSVLYDGEGVAQPLVVDVPGAPTGIVYNGGPSFLVSDGVNSGPAVFLFAGAEGTISAWSPGVPPPAPSTQAIVAVDNSAANVSYTGLAIASTLLGERLYAADFRNRKVDVFDGAFAAVTTPGGFVDPRLPDEFSPFGIQNLNGRIVVSYAKLGPEGTKVDGQGLGIVNVFDTEGTLLARAATRGQLNAPWGMAIAPASFGEAGGRLLVSNSGDGKILMLEMSDDMLSFHPAGVLRGTDRLPIVIEGIRGIGFGNGQGSGSLDTLYFASGPNQGEGGAFGRIDLGP